MVVLIQLIFELLSALVRYMLMAHAHADLVYQLWNLARVLGFLEEFCLLKHCLRYFPGSGSFNPLYFVASL